MEGTLGGKSWNGHVWEHGRGGRVEVTTVQHSCPGNGRLSSFCSQKTILLVGPDSGCCPGSSRCTWLWGKRKKGDEGGGLQEAPPCVALPSVYVMPDSVLRVQTGDGKCQTLADEGSGPQWVRLQALMTRAQEGLPFLGHSQVQQSPGDIGHWGHIPILEGA